MSIFPTYLIHYGVPGQKWGERQWQNPDGTWTEAGKERRRVGDSKNNSKSDFKGNFAKSIKDDVKTINGGKVGYRYGFNRNENCAFCSVAYELKRRGHEDIRAQESLRGVQVSLGNKNGAFGKIIPNFSKISKNTINFAERATDSDKMVSIGMTRNEYSDMVDTLTKQGEGARGFITVSWRGWGGHIFNYEVNNGQLYFVDAQPGTVRKANKSYYSDILSYANNIQTLRTDNIKMNEDKAKKYYAESTDSKIRINKVAKREPIMTLIGGILGLPALHFGVIIGSQIAKSASQKKSKKLDDEASIELQNKWQKEGRFKEKWYDIKTNDKGSNNSLPKNIGSRIESLASSGLTYKQIAKRLGISESTVSKYIK